MVLKDIVRKYTVKISAIAALLALGMVAFGILPSVISSEMVGQQSPYVPVIAKDTPLVATAHAQTTPPDPVTLPRTGNCSVDNIYYGAVPPGGEDGRVLIFVHGYGGLPEDWWTAGSTGGFNDMYILAYNAGYRTAFVNPNVNVRFPPNPNRCLIESRNRSLDMLNNGVILSRQINAIRAHYNVYQVDIVAHSKGGIDAQTAAVWFGSWRYIRNIFTIATPHQGSLLADLLWTPEGRELSPFNRDRATLSMRTGIMQLYRFFTDQAEADDNINYYTGAGNFWDLPDSVYEITGPWLQDAPAGGDNDGAVTVASTLLPYGEAMFLEPWAHSQVYLGSNAFPYIHARLLADSVAPSAIQLVGPTSGTLGRSYEFAAYLPATTTIPLDYTWLATEQLQVNGNEDRTTSKMSFTWDTPGTKEVTVVATNESGTATLTHEIVIYPLTAPTAVELNGAIRGDVDQPYTFEAMLPDSVTTPASYVWRATDQLAIQKTTGKMDSIQFRWRTPGEKVIELVVTNEAGSYTTRHTIMIGTPMALDPEPFPQNNLNNRLYIAQAARSTQPTVATIAQLDPEQRDDWLTSNTILRGGKVTTSTVETIPVEANATEVEFFLLTADANLQGELVAPNGSILAMEAVANEELSPLAGLTLLRQTAQENIAGEWQIKLTAPVPTGYLLLVTLESDLQVYLEGLPAASITPASPLQLNTVGGTASVTAILEQITATIGYPPMVEPLVTSAGADGTTIVTAAGSTLNLEAPTANGVYEIGVTVQGNFEGSNFERTFAKPLIVLSDDFTLSATSLKGLLEQWYCENNACTEQP